MKDYVSISEYTKAHPKTSYPAQFARYLFEYFHMRKGAQFADIGCGEGHFLSEFAKCGLQVIGVDRSGVPAQLHPCLDIRYADLEKGELPLEENNYDIIFSKSFIEHLNYPEFFFIQAMTALKPGGMLISMTPDFYHNYKIFYDIFTHRTPFTIRSLKVLYEITGYTNIQVNEFYQLPCAWKHPTYSYLFRLIAPFVPPRSRHSFFRWVREIQVLGVGFKPADLEG